MRHFAPLCVLVALIATAVVGFAQSAPADKPKPARWLVHAIEMSTEKDGGDFTGTVVLKLDGAPATQIAYHWGRKCKDSKLGSLQLDLLMHALDHAYAVELQGEPKRVGDRVAICMRSVRVMAP